MFKLTPEEEREAIEWVTDWEVNFWKDINDTEDEEYCSKFENNVFSVKPINNITFKELFEQNDSSSIIRSNLKELYILKSYMNKEEIKLSSIKFLLNRAKKMRDVLIRDFEKLDEEFSLVEKMNENPLSGLRMYDKAVYFSYFFDFLSDVKLFNNKIDEINAIVESKS